MKCAFKVAHKVTINHTYMISMHFKTDSMAFQLAQDPPLHYVTFPLMPIIGFDKSTITNERKSRRSMNCAAKCQFHNIVQIIFPINWFMPALADPLSVHDHMFELIAFHLVIHS